jgi:hypothetical protein
MLFLLSVFIFPIAVKSLHFHENEFHCNAKNEKHFHNEHENCSICDYEFSIFTLATNNIHTQKNEIYVNNKIPYILFPFIKKIYLSYLLRAPPQNI